MKTLAMRRIAAALLLAPIAPAAAQEAPRPGGLPMVVSPPSGAGVKEAEPGDPSLSPECRVPGSQLYTLAQLKAVKAALQKHRPVRVLAIGGNAAPGASATYPVKLETALERMVDQRKVLLSQRAEVEHALKAIDASLEIVQSALGKRSR